MADTPRRTVIVGAGAVAISAALPSSARSPVDIVMELKPEVGYDGPRFAAALASHLGWTDGRTRTVMKAAIYNFCILPLEQCSMEVWLNLIRREVALSMADETHHERPEVLERARIGKCAEPG